MAGVIRLSEEQYKNLCLIANGNPHLLIVYEEESKRCDIELTKEFDFYFLFEYLKQKAKKDKEFKEELIDFIIDVSQEV